MKIRIREAEKIVPVKRATLYRHVKEGKISSSKDPQNKTVVDIAELKRFYGTLNTNGSGTPYNGTNETDETGENGQVKTPVDPSEIVDLLREQLADTKAELTDAKSREKQLLSMLETEQEKTKLLMLAPPPEEKRTGWWNRLTGK